MKQAMIEIGGEITSRGAERRLVRPRRPGRTWLWLPATLVVVGLFIPLVYLMMRALSADQNVWSWLLRPQTLSIVARSLGLALAVSLASALIAVPLAWLVTRTDLPFRRFWTVLIPLPLVIPSYVGAYLFVSALGPRGLVQSLLQPVIGVQRLPDLYGFPGALIVLTILSYPFIYLTVQAAFSRIDRSMEEAARSLGLSPWATFWRVVFPQIRTPLASGGLLVALYVLRDFGAVSVLRYTTFTRAIYVQYQSSFDRAAAALLSLVLIALTILILTAESRLSANQQPIASHAPRPPVQVRLNEFRWPALFLSGLVVFLGVFLPASVLGYWFIRGILVGETIRNLGGATLHSVGGAALGSAVAVVAAIPIAYLHIRHPGWFSRLYERVAYIGFALPGIVIALSLVFFGANFTPWLYQTLMMLVLAYTILFLPQAIGSIRSALQQVHPQIEEAGRSLGAGPLRVFARLTLPLILPGIASGTALIFLTIMKELPATLILAPIGFNTLATETWSAVSEAFFTRAAAPALLLIVISSLPMAILNFHQRK